MLLVDTLQTFLPEATETLNDVAEVGNAGDEVLIWKATKFLFVN